MEQRSSQEWSPTGTPADVVADVRRWLAAPAVGDAAAGRVVITTSGSTGAPKQVLLSRAAVLASVAASAERLGASGRWALALPATYVAGLQVIVRSLVAGHDPALLTPCPDGSPGYDGWPDGEGWFTSLVPTQLGRLLHSAADTAALRRAHTVLVGGGPIDPGLRARATAAGIRTVATYGAAETAGGCVYDGLPLAGVRLGFEQDGRIRIAGPTLFDGYRDAALTRETLVDGWYRTSDAGRLADDGRLQVLGRIDDVVLSGGVNVPATAVAARLREHPDLTSDRALVEVLGVEDPEWGQRVVAFVAPVAGAVRAVAVPPLDTLRAFGAEQHPRSWAVRQVVVLEEMPLLASGKPDRVALRRLAAATEATP